MEYKNLKVKIIYFVHGTTTDNLEHKAAGWNDVKLSEKGIKQSIELREKIDFDDIDVVITSDLTRAKQSATNVFGGQKIIIVDDRLRECNYGDLNGKDSDLVKYEEHIYMPFPNGESLMDVKARIEDFCEYLFDKFDGKTVAIVAHRAPQIILEHLTKKITIEEAIENDWRKTKDWKPGWKYEIKTKRKIRDTLDKIEHLD